MSEKLAPYNIVSISRKGERPFNIKNPHKSFSFGTDDGCQIRLKDVKDSGFASVHCQITPIEGKIFLVSHAATLVNGQPTKGIPVALNNGDMISMGKGAQVNFRYETGAANKPTTGSTPFKDITQQVVVSETPIKVEKSPDGQLAHSSSSLFETTNGSQDRSRHGDEDSAEDKENNPSGVTKERRPTPEVDRPETDREEAPKSDVATTKSTPAKPLSRKLTYSDAMVPPPQTKDSKKALAKSSSSSLAVDNELQNYEDEEIQQVSLSSAIKEVEQEPAEEKKTAKTPKKQAKTPKKNTKAKQAKETEEKEEVSEAESKAEEVEEPAKGKKKAVKTPKKQAKKAEEEPVEESEASESKVEEVEVEEPVKQTKAKRQAKTPKKQTKKAEEKPVEESEDNEASEAAEEPAKGKKKAAKTPKKQAKKVEEKPAEESEVSESESKAEEVEEPKQKATKKGAKTPKKNTKAKKAAEKVEESEPEEVAEAEPKTPKKGAKTPKNTKAKKETKKEDSEPEKESEAEEESVKEVKKSAKKTSSKSKAVEKSESEKEESEVEEQSEQEKPEFKTPTKKSSKTPSKAYIANATYDSPNKSPTKSPRPLIISPDKRYQKVVHIGGIVAHEVYSRWVPKGFDINKDKKQPRMLRNSPERKNTNFLAQKVYPGTAAKSTKKSKSKKNSKKQASAPNSPTKTVKTPLKSSKSGKSVKKEIKIKTESHKAKSRPVEHFDAPDERSRMEILNMSMVNMIKEQLALMNAWVSFDEIYMYHRAHYSVLNMDALRDIVKELVNEEVVSMSTKSKTKRYCLAGAEPEEPVNEAKIQDELPENETDDEESEDEGDLRTDLQQQMMQIWSRVKSAKSEKYPQAVLPFMHRPSKQKYPEYYASVSRVVTMKMILQAIKAGDYETMEDMAKDFRQMFVNFKRFNRPQSDVYRCGALLEKEYKAGLKAFKEAANEKHDESEHSEHESEAEEREQSSDRESDNEDEEEKSERDEESENGSDNEDEKSGSDNEQEDAQESVKESVESDDE
eukprot:TRINITY_DN4526_c0_g1_i1.p1 TRINITY_DN4526_c0_g1~~TRINITY_DN4526_c0_g1_i1.p1  ORF type:complete len:1022 (+),score=489.04 TRINITY_DN4526_c0_g1_i1:19-3084(+)